MRFSVPYCIGVAVVVATAACTRPADESKESAPARTETATPNTPTPADTSTPAEKTNPGPAPSQGQQSSPPTATAPGNTPPPSTAANLPPAGPAPAVDRPTTTPTPQPPPSPPTPPPPPPPPPPEIVKVPAGTTLVVTTADAIATDKNKAGDTFAANIAEPVVINGKTVFPKGAKVQGRIETLDEPGRVKGKAGLSLVLTQVAGKSKAYTITTEPFTAQADPNTKKDAKKIAGGAGIGAVVGAIAGGGKGAAIGAAIGGGAGTTAVLVTKGDQLTLEPETKVNFVLKNGIDVQLERPPN